MVGELLQLRVARLTGESLGLGDELGERRVIDSDGRLDVILG